MKFMNVCNIFILKVFSICNSVVNINYLKMPSITEKTTQTGKSYIKKQLSNKITVNE